MDITKELGPMLAAEERYIETLKNKLAAVGEILTDKSQHDLRMGYRTLAIVKIRLTRGVRT